MLFLDFAEDFGRSGLPVWQNAGAESRNRLAEAAVGAELLQHPVRTLGPDSADRTPVPHSSRTPRKIYRTYPGCRLPPKDHF